MKERKFKVGDVVKVCGDGMKAWGVPDGTRGVVIPHRLEFDEDSVDQQDVVNVRWDKGDESREWYAGVDELVLVESPFKGCHILDTPQPISAKDNGTPLSKEVKRPLELTSDQLADGCYLGADELVMWLEKLGFDVKMVER